MKSGFWIFQGDLTSMKTAIIKEGWTIAFDPYPIKYQEVKLLADLAGEKTISATKEEKQIVKELNLYSFKVVNKTVK